MNDQRCESSGCLTVDQYGEYIRIRSSVTSTVVQCTPAEWHAFLADVERGRWKHIGAESAVQQ